MAALHRMRVALTGFSGGPGVNTFYATDGPTMAPLLRGFFDDLKVFYPQEFNETVENSGDIFESTTGVHTGIWSTTTQAIVTGTSTNMHAAPAGALARWRTGTFLSGRQLVGRSFLVPLTVVAYNSSGEMDESIRLQIEGFCADLVTAAAGDLMVWQRPIAAGQPGGPRGGGFAAVTSASVSTKVAILRSRRD